MGSEFTDNQTSMLSSKNWYRYAPDDCFDFEASCQALADFLGKNYTAESVGQIIKSAFNSDSLSTIINGSEDTAPPKPFIQWVHDIAGEQVFILTQGDEKWQRTKFDRCGLESYVKPDHYFQTTGHKKTSLERILDDLVARQSPENTIVIYLIDDKPENLEISEPMQDKLHQSQITFIPYLMDLNDPEKSPDAFVADFQVRQKENPATQPFFILDMDGVVIDTGRVISTLIFPPAAQLQNN